MHSTDPTEDDKGHISSSPRPTLAEAQPSTTKVNGDAQMRPDTQSPELEGTLPVHDLVLQMRETLAMLQKALENTAEALDLLEDGIITRKAMLALLELTED